MDRCSNFCTNLVNVFLLISSLLSISSSVYIHVHDGPTECQKFLETPLMVVGVSLFVVSILGLVGSLCRVNFLMVIYLVLLFLLILGMIGFTIFAVIVTNYGAGKAVRGKGVGEYRVGDYTKWLQKRVVDTEYWARIRSCLVDSNVCSSLRGKPNETIEDFKKRDLSPTQSGCCKPPIYCGLEFKNATFWTIPKDGPAVPDSDCTTWTNDQINGLCYDCKSCKAGILENIRNQWRKLAIYNSIIVFLIIVVYSIGSCTHENNKNLKYYQRYGGYHSYP